jgi:DNA-binding YbaB/EbfC family protein
MSDEGPTDFDAFAERARRMRGELAQFKDDLATIQATGYGDGGLVTATVSGEGRILDLRIDSSVIDPDDPETLSRLVVAAIEDATQAVAEQRAQRVGGVSEGIGELFANLRGNAPGAAPKVQGRASAQARRQSEQGASGVTPAR